MKDFEVGTSQFKKCFDCLKCAEDFYNSIEGKKYLAKCRFGKPIKIILNTYGWELK